MRSARWSPLTVSLPRSRFQQQTAEGTLTTEHDGMAARHCVHAFDQNNILTRVFVDRAHNHNDQPEAEQGQAWQILIGLLAPVTSEPATLATQLLHRFGALNRILSAHLHELVALPGVTLEAAQHLTRLHRALCFCLEEKVRQRPVIGSSSQLEEYVRLCLGWKPREHARMLLLDRKNHLLGDHLLAEGDVHSVYLTARQVVQVALDWNASGVILVHNHPTGDPRPSSQDIEFTRRVAEALAILDIALHDHIVVGRNRTFSMRAHAFF